MANIVTNVSLVLRDLEPKGVNRQTHSDRQVLLADRPLFLTGSTLSSDMRRLRAYQRFRIWISCRAVPYAALTPHFRFSTVIPIPGYRAERENQKSQLVC